MVKLAHATKLKAKPGAMVQLSAKGTSDPDGDQLKYKWWVYTDASTYKGNVVILTAASKEASLVVPGDIRKEQSIHVICEVNDTGSPVLTRYQRVVITIQ